MKRIEAIIQPHKLEAVKEALQGMGVDGMTVTDVRGHGRQKGHTETYRGQEYKIDLLPKVKIDMAVPEIRAEQVIEAIANAARSGKIGDGKIFISSLEDAIRIRNGDRGEGAL
ncbi:MAG TPA: P-II family nitrogen regulator [Bryobacteraceae bacterium]|nr:P-II family nitrogen regulator [Bryobacteraceae bacterium]